MGAKNAYDPVGHYSRPDVLQLLFNGAATPRVVRNEQPESERRDTLALSEAEPA